MKLYWGSGSPVSWRVQLGLAFKRIPYDSHRLDLGNKEHHSETFRAISPRGTFPVLVDADVTVRDSIAILAYLDRRQPSTPLFGETPAQAAAIWQLVAEHEDRLATHATVITQALFRDSGFDDPDPVRAAVDSAHTELHELEMHVKASRWLVGEGPSAAEAVYYPTVHRLLRAATKPAATDVGLTLEPLAETYSGIAGWLARLDAQPGVPETYPPHWRQG